DLPRCLLPISERLSHPPIVHRPLCSFGMESLCLDACGNLTLPRPPHLVTRRRYFRNPFSPPPLSLPEGDRVSTGLRVSCSLASGRRKEPVRARKNQNVWSIDNDLAAAKASAEDKTRKYRRRRGRRVRSAGRRGSGARVLVSGSMLMEIETVLQTQEPVIKPAWDTFASSVSGIWKGVGAVFSPFTAEIEPIGIGKKNENLYDCYTRSLIEKVSEDGVFSHIRRKTNWAALNPFGESKKHRAGDKTEAKDGFSEKETLDVPDKSSDLPSYDSFDLSKGEDLEEDVMGMEPGLVFFEFDMKPFSHRKRTQPSELTGSWKVFEVSATPIFSEEPTAGGGLPFVYLCTETLKKRSLPESSVSFGEEEVLDMQDVTVLWLPGGVTGYVDVNKDGILTIGVGWYSDEGINLVMERDYGMDGKLKEVRWKSEVKRRWTDS
ncbi:hypothetical protein GW17_00017581, partial [Ensete ventricosum]